MIYCYIIHSSTQFKEGEEEKTDYNLEQAEVEPSSMANIFYNKSHHLCGLLKAVYQHIIDSCIILPYIKTSYFATMTNVTILLPLGYSAIAEAVNSAATTNHLDCYW